MKTAGLTAQLVFNFLEQIFSQMKSNLYNRSERDVCVGRGLPARQGGTGAPTHAHTTSPGAPHQPWVKHPPPPVPAPHILYHFPDVNTCSKVNRGTEIFFKKFESVFGSTSI